MNAKVILICLMVVAATNAYSSGAPDSACFDMVPQHHVDPQVSTAPYEILLSKNQLVAGKQDKVDITIRAIPGLKDSVTIKGFMIQARNGTSPIGKWLVDKNNSYGQTLSCGSKSDNAVTHKKIDGDGPKNLTFTWQAPPNLEAVRFQATIALNGGVFWVKIMSPVFIINEKPLGSLL